MKRFAFALMSVSLLAACSTAKQELGLTRQSPDEFSVIERAPLSLPPDYTLRPPRSGGPAAATALSAESQARRVVLGSEAEAITAPSSATEMLLQKAGATQPQPGIRATLDKETSVLSTQNRTVSEKLLFWDKDNASNVPPAEKLDPQTEAQRLNQSGIKSPTPGQMTPTSQPAATTAK